MRRAALALAALLSLGGCATPPPPPPPEPVSAEPALPATPIPKDQYLSGWFTVQVSQVFMGTAALQPGLQWLVEGSLTNRGNREVDWVEVQFDVRTTGKTFRHIVIDPLSGNDAIPPGETQAFVFPVCALPDGIAGEYDASSTDHPPPQIAAKIVDLKFSDES